VGGGFVGVGFGRGGICSRGFPKKDMKRISEIWYNEFISPLNLFDNEKEVIEFCQKSDKVEDLEAFRKACFEYGGVSFVHLIDDRIAQLNP
jgi:acyl-[acyl carrier protein]--UDP-N-acetylglucosamine O-acyltransferase